MTSGFSFARFPSIGRNAKHYNSQKKKRLIEALQIVSLHRSIATAKSLLKGYQLDAFKHTLSELSNLNINPVTIPNLLYIYYRKAKMAEFEWLSSLNKSIHKHNKLNGLSTLHKTPLPLKNGAVFLYGFWSP